jgi:SagB-type dehydrogenase family enzyme
MDTGIWREYHEATKHSPQSVARSRHVLDWPNMPDPFRHYEGTPLLDLPADPPTPEISTISLLEGSFGGTTAKTGPEFLSQLFFYSAAISASKVVPSTAYRYALRVNPSSGNLHPTEFHFFTRGLKHWPDGLYHYRPSSHMAEQRVLGRLEEKLAGVSAPIVFILTSVAWREAWKYQDRAYRYCLHDAGHAWQSLTLAARAIGCDSFATGHFPDDEISLKYRFHQDEWPMLLVELDGASIPLDDRPLSESGVHQSEWSAGTANQLSQTQTAYPLLNRIHAATKLTGEFTQDGCGRKHLPTHASSLIRRPPGIDPLCPFGKIARSRRSALDFQGGDRTMSLAQLSTVLSCAAQPLSADFARKSFIQLYLYVHRVEGLEPGVYRHEPEHSASGQSNLEKIKSGDQRLMAAALCLRQDMAGNACAAFSLVGDLSNAAQIYGDRAYRYVHFEAGAIGQTLYLAAEALGLGASGIGAFFDDEVNTYLGLNIAEKQVVYHFAIGYPVPDPRLKA